MNRGKRFCSSDQTVPGRNVSSKIRSIGAIFGFNFNAYFIAIIVAGPGAIHKHAKACREVGWQFGWQFFRGPRTLAGLSQTYQHQAFGDGKGKGPRAPSRLLPRPR